MEENVLDGIERVFSQATEGLNEKGGKDGGKERGLGHRLSQLH